jgi:hypothetical protein
MMNKWEKKMDPKERKPLTFEESMALRSNAKTFLQWNDLHVHEHNYRPVERVVHALWTPETASAVANGQPCPTCRDKGKLLIKMQGDYVWDTVKEPCYCLTYKFVNEVMATLLPPLLRTWGFHNLKPSYDSTLSMARQKAELKALPEQVDDGHIFYGPPGTSKSTYCAALIRANIWKRLEYFMRPDYCARPLSAIIILDGFRLFQQEQDYATADDKSKLKRDITPEKIDFICSKGVRPLIVLEELDKRKITEFAANVLFKLMDKLDQVRAQLIITTNLAPQAFRDLFLKSDIGSVRVAGEALLRRVDKLCNQKHDYFSKGEGKD